MAISKIQERRGSEPNIWTCLEADTRPTSTDDSDLVAGDICFVSDTGSVETYTGSSWTQTKAAGADNVNPRAFTLGATADVLATSTSAASETIPTGATKIFLSNLSTTAAEYMLFAFGTDDTDAETNLGTGAGMLRAASDRVLEIPDSALGGGFAWKSASGTPSLGREYGT